MLITNIDASKQEYFSGNVRRPFLSQQTPKDSFEKASPSYLKFSGKKEELFQAIKVGNTKKTLELIRTMDGDPDVYRDDQGNTGLMKAAYYGKLKVAQDLHGAGANLQAVNTKGNTAWMIAAQKGQTSLLNFCLLQMKKSGYLRNVLNRQNNEGDTALMLAVKAGQYNSVKLLRQYHPNLEIQNQAGQNVFDLAQAYQYQQIYRLLRGEREGHAEQSSGIVVAPGQNTHQTDLTKSTGTSSLFTNVVSPERTLIELFQRADLLSERVEPAAFISAINSSECKEYFSNRLKRNIDKDANQTIIIKNKLCYLYSKEKLESAKNFWNDIAKNVFQQAVGVLAGITGLHRVLGMDDIKQDLLVQVILPLIDNDPTHNTLLILHGIPGGGKTLIAESIAEHLDYPISKVKASKLLTNTSGNAFYGEAGRRILNLFEQAREQAPIVLFFDEFDSIARVRSQQSANSSSVDTDELLNAINATIDYNKQSHKKVLIIGATNNLEHLDTAIARNDRAYKIKIPPCNKETRLVIIRRELQADYEGVTVDHSINIERFASLFLDSNVDITPSDIKAAFKHARNVAKRLNKGILSEEILYKSFDKALEEKVDAQTREHHRNLQVQ